MDANNDPFVKDTREQLTALDRSIFDAVNRRLELVARLKQHKAEHGYSFIDPNREQEMLDAAIAANSGPLSDEGLRRLYAELLELTKRELD